MNEHKSLPMNSSLINVQPSSFCIAANAAVVVVQHVLLLRIQKKRRLRKQRRWNCRIRQQRSVWKFLTSLVIPKGIPDELQFLRPPCNPVVRVYHTGIWPEGKILVGQAARPQWSNYARNLPCVRSTMVYWWLGVWHHDNIRDFAFQGIQERLV